MQNWLTDISNPYLLAAVAVLFAHASFQLAISVLTLLSSHTIGAGRSQQALIRLAGGYVLGVILATTAALTSLASLAEGWQPTDPRSSWLVLALLAALAGLLTAGLYYRRRKGTTLWVPRAFADYLTTRTKKTRSGIEALGLGIMTVVAELPFTIVPLLIVAFMVRDTAPTQQLMIIAAYSLLACLPLIIVGGMITSGHKISTIQRWREGNKNFLQWSGGLTLMLVSIYLVVLQQGGSI